MSRGYDDSLKIKLERLVVIMASKKTQEVIEIRPLDIQKVQIRIVGDTPLITHKWSEKAKKQMLDAQQGKKRGTKKEPKDPFDDFKNAAYLLTDPDRYPESAAVADEVRNATTAEEFEEACAKGAKFGFPATALKDAAISAAYRMGWAKDKVSLKGAFFLDGDIDGLIEIKSDTPRMREDMVKVGMGTADLRYRPEFRNWHFDVTISYNANGGYSLENLLTMINAGGYTVGIGEWRVEKSGQYGMFHVE